MVYYICGVQKIAYDLVRNCAINKTPPYLNETGRRIFLSSFCFIIIALEQIPHNNRVIKLLSDTKWLTPGFYNDLAGESIGEY